MTSLSGKTLFITGASRGIGLEIAKIAAKDGANIVIAAKTAEPHPKLSGTIHTAAAEIEQLGGKALPVVVDVREHEPELQLRLGGGSGAGANLLDRQLALLLIDLPGDAERRRLVERHGHVALAVSNVALR